MPEHIPQKHVGASEEGRKLLLDAREQKKISYHRIHELLSIPESTVKHFFYGKNVEREKAIKIINFFVLKEEDILNKPLIIDKQVKDLCNQMKLRFIERWGQQKVLDMTHPVHLKNTYIYTRIQEFNKQGRQSIDQRNQQTQEGLSVVKNHSKLIIWGKPGAGKTTFLKYLAIECIEGTEFVGLVPILIMLKDFAVAQNKPSLKNFLICYVKQMIDPSSLNRQDISAITEELLQKGKMFISLDGLDEVPKEESTRVNKEIDRFLDSFPNNRLVLSSRIRAQEYQFPRLDEFEIADFGDEQIDTFAQKRFKDKNINPETFCQELKKNNQIKELARTPLLLTLLCWDFEQSSNFPKNLSELCERVVKIQLNTWDVNRGVCRAPIPPNLSVQDIKSLLSYIAIETLIYGDSSFKKKVVEAYIRDYFRDRDDVDFTQVNPEEILEKIEENYGLLIKEAGELYSFSHSIFHEYFAACFITGLS